MILKHVIIVVREMFVLHVRIDQFHLIIQHVPVLQHELPIDELPIDEQPIDERPIDEQPIDEVQLESLFVLRGQSVL
jgi:hypothetical protein